MEEKALLGIMLQLILTNLSFKRHEVQLQHSIMGLDVILVTARHGFREICLLLAVFYS